MKPERVQEIRGLVMLARDGLVQQNESDILDALDECCEELERWNQETAEPACARCGCQRVENAKLYCSLRCCPYSYDSVRGACRWCAQPRRDHPGKKS
jgi:hypothetical protein